MLVRFSRVGWGLVAITVVVGIAIATAYTASAEAGAAISMNHGMAPGDPDPRDPVVICNYDTRPGDDFKVYYSLEALGSAAPCHETRPGIDGWVCR